MDFSWLGELPAFVIDYIVQIVFALFVAFLLPVIYRFFKIKADDSRRVLVEAALQNGIRWAIQQAIAAAAKRQGHGSQRSTPTPYGILSDPLAKAQIVADASDYVKEATPSALKHLKVTAASLDRAIEARIPVVVDKDDSQRRLL